MTIERFLDDNLNAPDDISRLKGLLLEGNTIDHVTVAIKFESGADIKEAIQKHLATIYGKPYMIHWLVPRIL